MLTFTPLPWFALLLILSFLPFLVQLYSSISVHWFVRSFVCVSIHVCMHVLFRVDILWNFMYTSSGSKSFNDFSVDLHLYVCACVSLCLFTVYACMHARVVQG
jgi:hypothetical protein